jgi:hypothetical protein
MWACTQLAKMLADFMRGKMSRTIPTILYWVSLLGSEKTLPLTVNIGVNMDRYSIYAVTLQVYVNILLAAKQRNLYS